MRGTGALIALALIAALPSGAAGGPATRQNDKQVVHGGVVVATGDSGIVRDDGEYKCSILNATAHWGAGDSANGLFAFGFEVKPGTHGAPFVLSPTEPADFDITFSGPKGPTDYDHRGLIKERGIVPRGAEYALVCMASGIGTSFKYVARGRSGSAGS